MFNTGDPNSIVSHMVKGTLSLGMASMVNMVLGLVTVMVSSRLFPPNIYGSFILLQVVTTFLCQISTLGLNQSIPRFISATEDDRRRGDLINTAFIIRFGSIFVVSIAAWCARPLLEMLFGASNLGNVYIYIPLLFLLAGTYALFKAILQGCFLFIRAGIADLIAGILRFVFILVFVFLLGPNVTSLILAYSIASFLACIFAFLSIPTRKGLPSQWGTAKEIIRFGFPLQLNDFLSITCDRVDTIIIGIMLGPAEIAFYEVARKIPSSLNAVFSSFLAVYFPTITKLYISGEKKKAVQLLENSTRLTAFFSLLGAAITVVFGKEIITLLFSDKYSTSAPVFMFLMINLSLTLIIFILGTSLVALGDSNKPVLINLIHTTASVLGNLLLIPPFGIVGAAVASLVGPILTNPLNIHFLRRRLFVKVAPYLTPMLIFVGWVSSFFVIKPSSLFEKGMFLLAFVFLCGLFSVIKLADFRVLWGITNVSWMNSRRGMGWDRDKP